MRSPQWLIIFAQSREDRQFSFFDNLV